MCNVIIPLLTYHSTLIIRLRFRSHGGTLLMNDSAQAEAEGYSRLLPDTLLMNDSAQAEAEGYSRLLLGTLLMNDSAQAEAEGYSRLLPYEMHSLKNGLKFSQNIQNLND